MWIILWFVFDLGAELVLEFLFEITRTLDADKVLRPFAVLWLVALGLVVGAASTTWYGGMSMGLGLAAGRLSILMFVRAL